VTYDLGCGSPIRQSLQKWALARLSLLMFCLTLGLAPAVSAQTPEHPSRKVIWRQNPDYPPVLKNAKIGGVVRLNVAVLPNGTVRSADILGGNPILADNAVKAVMSWKYAPAAKTTNEIVRLDFNPR
jgi:TonB family protein